MDADHQRRVARDEGVFRRHNEAVHAAIRSFRALADEDATHGFMCECPVDHCRDTIELTMDQYEHGRSDSAWSLVTPEHVLAGAERVIRDCGAYWIVAVSK